MENIKNILINRYGFEITHIDDFSIYASDDFITSAVLKAGPEYLLRMAPAVTFDDSGNSVVIGKTFENSGDLCLLLSLNREFVLSALLKFLSAYSKG